MMNKVYVSIDLKSFYASVECIERNLDPLTTNLVVADESRTHKTICLAVSPPLKQYGISGRARLFEVYQKVKQANAIRKSKNNYKEFTHKVFDDNLLKMSNDYEIDFIIAKPRMAHYIEYSTRIYNVYLKYIAPQDIHVYSIDEVFIDITPYLKTYNKTPYELTKIILNDVYKTTNITATAGIGTNLYLCKVAMDIVAKRIKPDKDGARIATLDEMSYRKTLWNHKPITDFWRVGKGYKNKLEKNGLYTMGDIAKCSVGSEYSYHNEDLLYKLFGINAELLIDHAWGYEPCTIEDIKSYKPQTNSICTGQVLDCGYDFEKARLVILEMADLLSLDLVEKNLVTDQIVLTIGYDIDNMTDKNRKYQYKGDTVIDAYGRVLPKPAHGTKTLKEHTSSTKILTDALSELFEKIVNKNLLVRKINISANRVINENKKINNRNFEQLNLFVDYSNIENEEKENVRQLQKEKQIQKAMVSIKQKYGKNAVLKGMNLQKGATARDKNEKIGGHKA